MNTSKNVERREREKERERERKRDDASISTSASTRRLCPRRTGLHVGFLCLCLCLCLWLRRTCKPGFTDIKQGNEFINEYVHVGSSAV